MYSGSRQHIRDVDGPAFKHGASNQRPACRHKRIGLHRLDQFRREPETRGVIMEYRRLVGELQQRPYPLRKAGLRTEPEFQARREIEGRAADDLEHVRGRSLLLEGFTQLAKQPRILDGDHGLSGEVLDQRDLLVGERQHLLAIDCEAADEFVFPEHRDIEDRPRIAQN